NGRQCPASRFQRVIHLPAPLLNASTFLKLLQLDLKAHPPGAPVTKIHLQIEPAKPRPGQNGLFVPCSPEPEKLELTLARISAVVGEGRAGSPQLLDTHRPQAFEMRRFISDDFAHARNFANNGQTTATNLVTTMRIFRPPVFVSVHHQNGKPSHISS